jgi:flagellar basal body rod protein FlgG
MFLNASLSLALDRIAERAADVRRAYTPGATPRYDDVATAGPSSTFTFDPLAVAPPDGAYFLTAGERGDNVFTRDGSFAVRDGRLVAGDRRPVLGVPAGGGPLGELRIDAVDTALGRAGDAAVEPDGTLVYTRVAIDPRSGTRGTQRVVVGRVALARFPAGTRLEPDDGSGAAAPAGLAPHVGLPGDGDFASVEPRQRERSRVDIDESLARLKEAYLAFDALQAAEAARSRLGKTAMDLLK